MIIEMNIECTNCGSSLERCVTVIGSLLMIDPCPHCIKSAEEAGYANGYDYASCAKE